MTFVSKNIKLGKGNGCYQKDVNLQRRNPLCKQKFRKGQLCFFCEKAVKDSRGRKPYFWSVNKLHGHQSWEHVSEDYRPYLLGLVEKINKGEL